MEQFNALYSLAQRLLNDNNITTMVAVFEAEVKLCSRHKLSKFGISADNTLKMIHRNKQITIKIK
jgi:hypothetical protein